MPRTSSARAISPSLGIIAGMIPFTNEFVMLDVRPVILTGVGILNALERALFVNGTSKTKWGCRNDAAPVTCYYITITNIRSLLPLDTSSWLSLNFAAPFGQVRALLIRLSDFLRACMEESWKNRDAGSQDGETRPSPTQNTFDTAATASFFASRLTCV